MEQENAKGLVDTLAKTHVMLPLQSYVSCFHLQTQFEHDFLQVVRCVTLGWPRPHLGHR